MEIQNGRNSKSNRNYAYQPKIQKKEAKGVKKLFFKHFEKKSGSTCLNIWVALPKSSGKITKR